MALVWNLHTGSITLQSHIAMNNWFTTITKVGTDDNFVPPDNWAESIHTSSLNSLDDWTPEVDDHLPDLADKWLPDIEIAHRNTEQHWYYCPTAGPLPRHEPQLELDHANNENIVAKEKMPVSEGDFQQNGMDQQ
eukprot:2947030-Ditylum_brightwellii.AAC.2